MSPESAMVPDTWSDSEYESHLELALRRNAILSYSGWPRLAMILRRARIEADNNLEQQVAISGEIYREVEAGGGHETFTRLGQTFALARQVLAREQLSPTDHERVRRIVELLASRRLPEATRQLATEPTQWHRIGALVRGSRQLRGITGAELAAELETTAATVREIEIGAGHNTELIPPLDVDASSELTAHPGPVNLRDVTSRALRWASSAGDHPELLPEHEVEELRRFMATAPILATPSPEASPVEAPSGKHVGEWIRGLISERPGSQAAFGRMVRVAPGDLSRYVNELNPVPSTVIERIISNLNLEKSLAGIKSEYPRGHSQGRAPRQPRTRGQARVRGRGPAPPKTSSTEIGTGLPAETETALAQGEITDSPPGLPTLDTSGWEAYGRLFVRYQQAVGEEKDLLADYLRCPLEAIDDIASGHGYRRPELIAVATSFWSDSEEPPRDRLTAVSDSGWDEFGQLVRTLREVNGHSRGAFGEIINSFDVAVAEIESGAGAQYPSEVSAITASVPQFVAVHERPRGQAAAAPAATPAPPDVSAPVVAPVARQPASERDDEAYQRSLEGRIGDRTIVDAGWPDLIVLLRRQRLNTKLTVEGWATSTGTSAELVRRMEESGGGHENKNLRAVQQLAQALGEEDRARAMLIVGEVKRLNRANFEQQLRRTHIVLHFPGWDRTAWPGCGAFLQQQRELAELTIEALAELCEVPVSAVQEIERGGGYEPSFRDAIEPGRIAFRDLRNDSTTIFDKLRELNSSAGNDSDPICEELHTLLHNEQTRDYHSYRQILESRKLSPAAQAGDWQDLIVLAYQARRRSGPRREPVATTAGLPVAALVAIERGVAPLDHVSYDDMVALFLATKSGDDIPTDIKEKLQRLKTALDNPQAGGELPPSVPPSFRPRTFPGFQSPKRRLSVHSNRR